MRPEPAGVDHADKQWAGAVLGVADAFDQDAHDVEADVEADEVGECERTHRMSHAELEDLIDGLGRGDSLHDGEDGLVDQRHQDAVGDEACGVVDLDRSLAELLRQRVNRVKGLLRGL